MRRARRLYNQQYLALEQAEFNPRKIAKIKLKHDESDYKRLRIEFPSEIIMNKLAPF